MNIQGVARQGFETNWKHQSNLIKLTTSYFGRNVGKKPTQTDERERSDEKTI